MTSACRPAWLVVGALVVAAGVACRPAGTPPRATVTSGPGDVRVVSRNVEAGDYAGSARCAACHAEVVKRFNASPMHRMTRNIEGAEASAPFGGESLSLAGDVATLETHSGARFVRVAPADGAPVLYRVTRVIGGHHREDFVGVRVAGYDSVPALGDDELVLPVSYLIRKRRLRYKGYSVMVGERTRLQAGPIWDRTCIFCHNTVPLLSTLYGALAGSHAPHYQGEVVDALLPDDRAFQYRVADEGAFDAAIGREMGRLGASAPRGNLRSILLGAIDATRRRFTGDKLLEIGIGCESCHGGCAEHVADPTVRPSLLPRAPYLGVSENGAAPSAPADVEAHACARCHQVLFSRYPWTWEGGGRHEMPGGSHINSGEARDLLLGGCKGALACTACHDPHGPDDAAHLAELQTPRGNEVCLGCHGAVRSKEALRRHAHHDPDGAGGACLACHMPKKNMSLEGRLTRYHRIGSPTDPLRVLRDRPIECALCHADKSVESLVETMEAWWGERYDRDLLRAAYGDLGSNALYATLERGKPHERAVALAVLGEARDRGAARQFAVELQDAYPLVRGFAADALRTTFGDACDLHVEADTETQASERRRCAGVAGFDLVLPTEASTTPSHGEEPVED